MPEYSSNTLIPTDATKVPGMQGSNAGNFQLDALKAYILAEKAQANGLASLDADGKLNSSQIPASLDDVLVYASYASLPATGETGKLYITSDVNGTYYWNGTSYQILNQSFVRYRGSVSSLPSDPQPGDWFIAASSFSAYTSGHIYLYNGSSWDDVTAVFGQFVLKTDIAQTIGPEIDKVPSNAAVNGAINAIIQTTVFEFDYQQSFTGFLNSIWQNTYSVLGIEKSKIKGAIVIGESWISFSCFLAENSLIVQANSYYDYGSTSFHAKLVVFHSS